MSLPSKGLFAGGGHPPPSALAAAVAAVVTVVVVLVGVGSCSRGGHGGWRQLAPSPLFGRQEYRGDWGDGGSDWMKNIVLGLSVLVKIQNEVKMTCGERIVRTLAFSDGREIRIFIRW